MDYNVKSDLVKQLAQSMGLQGKTAKQPSNFDAATGTLYIGSKVYTPDQIEGAREFMHAMIDKTKPLGDTAYQSYEIAEYAIKLTQRLVMEKKGRIVIEEEE